MSWGHANVQGAACKKCCHELLKDPVPSPPLPVLLLDRWSRLVSTMVSHPSKYLIVGLSGKAIGDCVASNVAGQDCVVWSAHGLGVSANSETCDLLFYLSSSSTIGNILSISSQILGSWLGQETNTVYSREKLMSVLRFQYRYTHTYINRDGTIIDCHTLYLYRP